MGDERFEPGGDLSIAQTLVLAYQIHSRESGDPLPRISGGWYMPYYQYCLDNGILTVRDFPQSCLNDKATRYDMVAILDQAIPDDQMEAINTVRDGDIPDLGEGDELGDVVYRWYRAGVSLGMRRAASTAAATSLGPRCRSSSASSLGWRTGPGCELLSPPAPRVRKNLGPISGPRFFPCPSWERLLYCKVILCPAFCRSERELPL